MSSTRSLSKRHLRKETDKVCCDMLPALTCLFGNDCTVQSELLLLVSLEIYVQSPNGVCFARKKMSSTRSLGVSLNCISEVW